MLVTVVIPAYNAADFIRSTIESVLVSTHRDIEVLVVDDGSTDSTADVARSAGDDRVRVLSFDNGGLSTARNRGLQEAAGEVIAFLDADDLWDPDKLRRQLPLLDGENVCVGCKARYVSSAGRIAGVAGEDPLSTAARERIELAWLMPFPISMMIFRTNAVEQVGGFDQKCFPAEDIDFLSRLASVGRVTWVPEVLGSYRVHYSSISHTRGADGHEMAAFLRRRQAARAIGNEVTWEEFQATHTQTAKELRRVKAAVGFRAAAVAALNGQYVRAATRLAQAVLADPVYCVERAGLRISAVIHARRQRGRAKSAGA